MSMYRKEEIGVFFSSLFISFLFDGSVVGLLSGAIEAFKIDWTALNGGILEGPAGC